MRNLRSVFVFALSVSVMLVFWPDTVMKLSFPVIVSTWSFRSSVTVPVTDSVPEMVTSSVSVYTPPPNPLAI